MSGRSDSPPLIAHVHKSSKGATKSCVRYPVYQCLYLRTYAMNIYLVVLQTGTKYY